VIPCWETRADSPFDAGVGDCKEGREVLNILGEVDAGSARGVERLDVAVVCGDNFLDRGNSFSLRAWLMPLGVPDIITVALINQGVALFRCSTYDSSGEISAGEVCWLLVLNMEAMSKHRWTGERFLVVAFSLSGGLIVSEATVSGAGQIRGADTKVLAFSNASPPKKIHLANSPLACHRITVKSLRREMLAKPACSPAWHEQVRVFLRTSVSAKSIGPRVQPPELRGGLEAM
jgi:hypothetical protein